MTTILRFSGSMLATATALLAAQAAQAQQAAPANPQADVQDIVVTAQKRAQNLQKVPVTITALSSQAIESRGLTQITDLPSATPGLQISASSSGALQPFLRGVGSTANTVGSEGSVAIYVDGVYYARPNAGVFSLNNLERVEVLKGPQGTLFGRNASGGVIQLVTRDPSYDLNVRGTASYGNYDTFEGSLYATTGLTDKIALDIAASGRKQNDGFGRNVITGNKANYSNNYTLKSKLLIEPTDTTKIVLSGTYSYSIVPGLGNHYPGTTQGFPQPPGGRIPDYGFFNQRGEIDSYNTVKMYVLSGRIEQELSFATLTSITAYQHVKEYYQDDGDFSEQVGLLPKLYDHVDQFTQELQLASRQGSPFEWIVGAFYYHNISAYDRGDFTGYGGGGQFDFDTHGRQRSRSYAGYAQATYEVLPKLRVTGGIRYTKDKIDASGYATFRTTPVSYLFPPSTARTGASKVTWKGGLDYQLSNNALLYSSVSRSFKSGQFAILFFAPGSTPTDPEVLTAYEAGIKTNLFDRRLRLNAAVFKYDIDKPQVQLIQLGAVIQSNAGAERIYGAEFDGEARLTDNLSVRFSGSYLDAKYTDYPNAPSSPPIFVPPFGTAPTVNVDAKGNRPPLTAKFTYSVGADYTLPTSIGTFKATVDFTHNSGFFWEQDNVLRQRPIGLLDARLRYSPRDKFGISIWGKNLTNEAYAANALSLQGTGGYPYVVAPPRTYGVTIDFDF